MGYDMAVNENFLDYLMGRGIAFNPYGAGKKKYGSRGAPNIGPVDKSGYRERDARAQAHRNALLRRLKAGQRGQYMNPDYLRMMR